MAMNTVREFFQHLYDEEWSRRAEVREATALPAGVLTLLAGVLLFYVRTYSFPGGWLSTVFDVSTALAAGAFLAATYSLVRSLFGPPYRRLPWPSEMHFYYEELVCCDQARGGATGGVEQKFEHFLVDRYVDAADRNSVNNANSGEYLHKANRAVVVALVFVAIAAYPIVMDFRHAQREPQKVEIVNAREMQRDNRQTRATQPGVTARTSATADSGRGAGTTSKH